MESLQVPRPSWMTEDLVLLEEQARRFLASELVPHVEKWTQDGIMERSGWNKLGQAGLLCASMPEEDGGAGGSFAHETGVHREIAPAGPPPLWGPPASRKGPRLHPHLRPHVPKKERVAQTPARRTSQRVTR